MLPFGGGLAAYVKHCVYSVYFTRALAVLQQPPLSGKRTKESWQRKSAQALVCCTPPQSCFLLFMALLRIQCRGDVLQQLRFSRNEWSEGTTTGRSEVLQVTSGLNGEGEAGGSVDD